jgi:uncharacterized protein (TIRG00374 family)
MPKKLHIPELSIKNVFTLLGFIGLSLIIIFNRHLLADSWHLVGQLHWYIIVVIIIVQLISYWLNAFYYRSILNVFNSYHISILRLFEAALATNYVNYMVPSAGAAGAGYLSQVLSPDVTRGESVLAQLMRSVFDALALLIMMPFGLFLIVISHQSRGPVIRESLISTSVVFIAAIFIFWFVYHESKLRKTLSKITRFIKHLYPNFGGEKAIIYFLNSFYKGYHSMFNKKKQMLVPFIWSVLYVAVELLTVYLVFLAFGKVINPGIVMTAYLIANIVSIFGGLLFSVGAFEVGMAGTFITLGIPSSLALSITVLYRAINLIISLPPGFYYYRKYLP